MPSHRFQAVGVGEISTAPGPSAVLMAVSNAIGRRITGYPATPSVNPTDGWYTDPVSVALPAGSQVVDLVMIGGEGGTLDLNLDSLTVGRTERPDVSRMTMVLEGTTTIG